MDLYKFLIFAPHLTQHYTFLYSMEPSTDGFFNLILNMDTNNIAKRVTFYIDGFNFYFGIHRSKKNDAKWQKAYWIDMVKLCQSFLGEGQTLEKVVYFTASPLNKWKNARQGAFLSANKLINGDKFEIVRGKYLEKHIVCPNCKYSISHPEEKKTDVNISIRMIADCVLNKTDEIILVSADSDLIPPMEFIKQNYPAIKIKVHFPPSNYSHDIKDFITGNGTKPVLYNKNFLKFLSATMPYEVTDGIKKYTIPDKWK